MHSLCVGNVSLGRGARDIARERHTDTRIYTRGRTCARYRRDRARPFRRSSPLGRPEDRLESKGNQPRAAHEWCQLNEGPPSSNCLFFDRIGPQKNIRCRDPNAARPVYGLVSRLLYSHNFRHLPVKLHAVETPDKFDKDSLLLFLFLFFFFFFLTFSALSSKRERENFRSNLRFAFYFAASISRLFARVNAFGRNSNRKSKISFFLFSFFFS